MARTTQKRRPTQRYQKNKTPANWLLLFLGILIGISIAGLIYLKENQDVHNLKKKFSAKKTTTRRHKNPSSSVHQDNEKPRFDFYTLLSNMKVSVPNEKEKTDNHTANESTPAKKTNTHPEVAKTNKSSKKSDYILQIASFKDYQDADNLKARLTLMGFDVKTTLIKTNDKSWHRVFIGPFNNEKIALKAQQELHSQHINSVLLKIVS